MKIVCGIRLVWAFVALTVVSTSAALAGEDKPCPSGGGPLSEAELAELSTMDRAAYQACQSLPTKDTADEYVRHFQSRISAFKSELLLLYTKLNTKELRDELERKTTVVPRPAEFEVFLAKALMKKLPFGEVVISGVEGAKTAADLITGASSQTEEDLGSDKGVEKIIRKYIDRLEALELNMNTTQTRRSILCQFAPSAPKTAKEKKKDEFNKTCDGLEKVRGTLDCRNLMHVGNSDKLASDKRQFASAMALNIAQNVQVHDREIGRQTTGMLEVTVKLNYVKSDRYGFASTSWDFTGFGGKDLLCQVLQNPKFREPNGELKEFVTLAELQLPVRVKFTKDGNPSKAYRTYGQEYGKMNSSKSGYTLGPVDGYRDGGPAKGPYTERASDLYDDMEKTLKVGYEEDVLTEIPIQKVVGKCARN